MRTHVQALIAGISPCDQREQFDKSDTLHWIASGAELCRRQAPATPPKHLVAYFPVIDGDRILLVDHIKAGLWLPPGGHVEPGERPADTVAREIREELGVAADFVDRAPLFLTVETTVGQTAGHTDVSLWYVLTADSCKVFDFDREEFREIRWFEMNALPLDRCDPNLGRFVAKYLGPNCPV